jgi:hypothetical protein
MKEYPIASGMSCDDFLEQLERLPLDTPGTAVANWGELLSQHAREHAAACPACEATLQDFRDTRLALAPMRQNGPEPGPWFVSRVMATIRAQQKQIEEQAEGVWVNIMRLAPRWSVLAALLLIVGGTWAVQLHRAQNALQQQRHGVEGLFESSPAPLNDDIVAVAYGDQQP